MSGPSRRDELEAAALLLVARLAVRIVPFRWLVPWFERRPRGRQVRGPARRQARREVRQAIARAGERLPGSTLCLPRAIAAQTMLRRRGLRTVLYCGAVTGASTSTYHAWVKDGRAPVVGVQRGRQYLPLLSYPSRSN